VEARAGRFKDFIAMPKVNMYQSLHTTVIGPKGDPVEIQIRTWEMHRIAEEASPPTGCTRKRRAARTSSTSRCCGCASSSRRSRTIKDPREFLDSVRVDLFPDEVLRVHTQGRREEGPARRCHPDRLRLRRPHQRSASTVLAPRSTGKLVPLRTTLRQGDNRRDRHLAQPASEPDWLKFVKSTRARTKINQWLKVEERRALDRAGPRAVRARAKRSYRL